MAAKAMLDSGAKLLQIRHKAFWSRDTYSLAESVADQCRQQSIALKQDWEAKAQPIREASQSKASPEAACKLITSFEEAEIKLINFMQANSARCQIPGDVIEKMKATHLTTEGLKQKTCKTL